MLKFFAILIKLPFMLGLCVVLSIRHWLYNINVFKSYGFDFPVIAIGNLTVGGTGKTPHTDILARHLLAEGIQVAILSRGYKRKSKGFAYVEAQSEAHQVGDEPLLLKLRNPTAIVAVCVDRIAGIKQIKADYPRIGVVLLDDALQYRRLSPGLSIMLTTQDNLVTKDYLLPVGRLRDLRIRRHAVEMVVITKCANNLRPIDYNILEKDVQLYPYQQLYFTRYTYGLPRTLGGGQLAVHHRNTPVLALAGIANPQPFFKHLHHHFAHINTLTFADHHAFTPRDVARIEKMLHGLGEGAIICTTEKDAMRLNDTSLSAETKARICYIPIEVEFLNQGYDRFIKNTISYVRENKRIGIFC